MNLPLAQPGELVWASILNALENRAATGKYRPVLLVRHTAGHWDTMGLTTNARYGDGSPRVPIPNPMSVGLRDPGFLWADHLTRVAVVDLGDHIGWADSELVETVIRLADLDDDDAAALRRSAAMRHSQPGAGTSEVA